MRIFRNKAVNIGPTTYDFFVIGWLFYDLRSLATLMLFGPCINSVRKRANQPKINYAQLKYYNSRAATSNTISVQVASPASPNR